VRGGPDPSVVAGDGLGVGLADGAAAGTSGRATTTVGLRAGNGVVPGSIVGSAVGTGEGSSDGTGDGSAPGSPDALGWLGVGLAAGPGTVGVGPPPPGVVGAGETNAVPGVGRPAVVGGDVDSASPKLNATVARTRLTMPRARTRRIRWAAVTAIRDSCCGAGRHLQPPAGDGSTATAVGEARGLRSAGWEERAGRSADRPGRSADRPGRTPGSAISLDRRAGPPRWVRIAPARRQSGSRTDRFDRRGTGRPGRSLRSPAAHRWRTPPERRPRAPA